MYEQLVPSFSANSAGCKGSGVKTDRRFAVTRCWCVQAAANLALAGQFPCYAGKKQGNFRSKPLRMGYQARALIKALQRRRGVKPA
jgi:hypothetical protein